MFDLGSYIEEIKQICQYKSDSSHQGNSRKGYIQIRFDFDLILTSWFIDLDVILGLVVRQ